MNFTKTLFFAVLLFSSNCFSMFRAGQAIKKVVTLNKAQKLIIPGALVTSLGAYYYEQYKQNKKQEQEMKIYMYRVMAGTEEEHWQHKKHIAQNNNKK